MKAYILTIGDEILIGQVTDTNATYMAEALSVEGYEVVEHLSVADTRDGIRNGLDRALAAADIVLMTGGLGPTKDDITKKVLAEYVGTEMAFHQESWERLVKIYAGFGKEAGPHHREQCELPASATVITNKAGTAPGMWFEHKGKIIVSMPGVPYEMRYLVSKEIIPRLVAGNVDQSRQRSLTILTAGLGESTLAEAIEAVEDALPRHISLAYLPNLGTVRLRLTTRGTDETAMQAELTKYKDEIEAIVGQYVYGYGKEDLALAVQKKMQQDNLTLATAESCTGGSIARMITGHAGSSGHFRGSVVAYDNDVKSSVLGVSTELLAQHGAVSKEVVEAMAQNARQVLKSDYAVATSGIAGPGGGSDEKPVGTIWIAVAGPDGVKSKLLSSGKDRKRNITYTVHMALNLLMGQLQGK
ncbi:competence/damage-inducible protein A [Neolewinella aurantiaca]|uniref:CinA-like protein n=1 Tax=Neolewinella aurantiaca TaxID=2602767 RepID=A0A5C7FJG0_9BACT|nr:competence/damage-inducible protein A [Neolewinella aurantiaca]TXF89995.1 competence/damage-inducible protein A [Neolewinella aurantiaca]